MPVKNELVTEREEGDGSLVLVLIRKENFLYRVLSRIFLIPKEKKFALDEMGRWVWSRCDGKNTVKDIMKGLSEEFKINRREAEISLMSFLKNLSKKKLVGFVLPEEATGDRN